MPFWISNLCDHLTASWLNATATNYWFMTFVVIGLGLFVARLQDKTGSKR